MTLDAMAAFVCAKVGKLDDYSKTLCAGFINRRYQMVWDAEEWKDTKYYTAVTPSPADRVTIPTTVDRVTGVRFGAASTWLEYVSIEEDAQLTYSGTDPAYYRELNTVAGGVSTRTIIFIPAPTTVQAVVLVVKRAFIELTGGDSPIIRNADNVLTTYATGDMLEYLKQYAKAQLKFTEAAAQLDLLRKVEQEQANQPRRLKSITASSGSLSEMVDAVCSRVNKWTVPYTIMARDFINRRYRMIWDTEEWKDAKYEQAVTVDPLTPGQVIIPANVDRVTGVVYGPNFKWLEYISAEQDAQITYTGTDPIYYREVNIVTDGVSSRKIVFVPPPTVAQPVVLIVKQAFVPLTDPDVPQLRNIDNLLVAYAVGDMLEQQGDYTNAQTKYTEAAALLDLMRKVEKEQANQPRKLKSITIFGDSLSEMVDAVCARCNQWTIPYTIMARDFLRRNYIDVYDAHMWPEASIIAEVDRDGSEIILPEYIDRVVSVRQNVNLGELIPTEQSLYFGIAPSIFEATGSPVAFSMLTSVGVAVLPPINETLLFVSSKDTDNSTVFIRGETQGVEVEEEIILNGTIPVSSHFPYDTPITIAKGITDGGVTVTGKQSSTILQILYKNDREIRHPRIWLQPTPTTQDGTKALILGKRKCNPLVSDEDTPILRGISNVLINLAAADLFGHLGDDKMSARMTEKATKALATLIDRETNQSGFAQRIVPYVEPMPYYEGSLGYDCGFLGK